MVNQVNSLYNRNIAYNILSSFGLSEDDEVKYKAMVEKFKAHSIKKLNVIFERTNFNPRK